LAPVLFCSKHEIEGGALTLCPNLTGMAVNDTLYGRKTDTIEAMVGGTNYSAWPDYSPIILVISTNHF
jgi:hypothetical protein